eukprot:TRINITY_DN27907_c0_g1_i1.p1 TRINITY_DN27907_c0_g1~~TRINITY_DN27907_c0_g1_i1.p1  ORF type:complete len:123 (-),score=11.31 TRINITY_DN27907_c0_g1_i1:10-378(-)
MGKPSDGISEHYYQRIGTVLDGNVVVEHSTYSLRKYPAITKSMGGVGNDGRYGGVAGATSTLASIRGPVLCVDTLSLIHISEPTRLLSISYAVFCLKKKKHNTLIHTASCDRYKCLLRLDIT